jgi:hypothetical protein
VAKKKTWKEKLYDVKNLPKVEEIPAHLKNKWGAGTMVISAPAEVNEIMKMVPEGKLITIAEIRKMLAMKHKSTIGCPLTTGIFVNIAAHAAEEDKVEGKKNITPYWRTLRTGGELNEKFPGGIQHQRELLENEGHHISIKRNKYKVENYEFSLI